MSNVNLACFTSYRFYGSVEALVQHMGTLDHWVPTYVCETCDKKFGSQQAADQHMDALDHWAPTYMCETCDKKFGSQQAADQHMSALKHRTLKYKCEKCDSTFGSQQAADKHMNTRGHWAPKFKCETCSRLFFSQASVETHMNAKGHWALKYGCETCSKMFESERLANEHMNALKHWPSPEFKCETCGRCFGSQEAVAQHMTVADHWAPKFQCETYDRSFYSEDSAKSHMETSGHWAQKDQKNHEPSIKADPDCQSKAGIHTEVHAERDKRTDKEQKRVALEPSPSLRSGNQDDQECINTLDPDDSAPLQDKTRLKPPAEGNTNNGVEVVGFAEETSSPQELTCPFCERLYVKASALIYHLELGFCFGSPAVNSTTLRTLMHQRDIHGIITNSLAEKCQEKLYRCPNRQCQNEFINLFALFSHLEDDGCSFMGFEKAKLFLYNVIQANKAIPVE